MAPHEKIRILVTGAWVVYSELSGSDLHQHNTAKIIKYYLMFPIILTHQFKFYDKIKLVTSLYMPRIIKTENTIEIK